MLGCLVEKQLTTPQHYPLTLNALTLACSQTTNREPVMALDDAGVEEALQELKQLHLARFVLPSHGKSVTRYRHVLDEAYGLDSARVALLAVLLLRGAQTPGELRARTARMAAFDSLDAIQAELQILADQPEPLVRLLPRQPGQKEDRWLQLLAAEASGVGQTGRSSSSTQPGSVAEPPVPHGEAAVLVVPAEPTDARERPGELEHRMEGLASEVAALRRELREVSASLAALRQSLGG